MWTLVLITLVNGGTSPPKIQEFKYQSYEQCIIAKKSREINGSIFGYCEKRKESK